MGDGSIQIYILEMYSSGVGGRVSQHWNGVIVLLPWIAPVLPHHNKTSCCYGAAMATKDGGR